MQFEQFITEANTPLLLLIMAVSMAILGKSADSLVDYAVKLSLRTGLPKVIVGATIVSIGTTFPEAVVSVLAAIEGKPQIALGNAVGSVICDTGLILGLACLYTPLKLDRNVVNRQGWVQFGAGLLLVILCLPFGNLSNLFQQNAVLPQWAGFFLVSLLIAYLVWSVRLAKHSEEATTIPEKGNDHEAAWKLIVFISVSAFFVVMSSVGLIDSAAQLAKNANFPPAVIAATIIAFGTSLPELVTAITAVRKGHGELAVGNVIGADILNVLFVAGLSAAVTTDGLYAKPIFFILQFPVMLFMLACFRIGIASARDAKLGRPFGFVLVVSYLIYLGLNIYWGGPE
ncbi:MAG: calcium/sodium antiporter [Planctomycetota bacterium]|nr:calcium/sodium antiporter [Planctomycetota bacterium]